jgi:hypothetical protein
VLTISVTLNAQRFKGGIIAGMNASQIDGDSWAGFYKGGLVAGAFVNTKLRDKFGAQLEIKYSAKGSAPHPDSYDYPKKIRLNYIDLPLIGSYETVKNLKLEAGLSINYLFKAEYYDGAWFTWDQEDEPNPFETSMLFGINYTLFQRFDFNLRFNYSLFPVRSKYSGSSWGEGSWYNQVVNFALYFHLGQREF